MQGLLQFLAGFKEFNASHSIEAAERAASRPVEITLPKFELCEAPPLPSEVGHTKFSMRTLGPNEAFQADYF